MKQQKKDASVSGRAKRRAGEGEDAGQQSGSKSKAGSKKSSQPKPKIYGEELTVMRLARFPGGGIGTPTAHMAKVMRKAPNTIRRAVDGLVRCGYLEEVGEGERAVVLTEFGREEAGFLFGDELDLVRLPAEEMAMRRDQLARLVKRPEEVVLRDVKRLIKRDYLEWKAILDGELEAIWPTERGLEEAGFGRSRYRTLPSLQKWPHTFTVVNVRAALLEEFAGEECEWESERVRSRTHPRTKAHMPDGVLIRENGDTIAIEVELTPDTNISRVRNRMLELAKSHAEVRYFCGKTSYDVVASLLAEVNADHMSIHELPGEVIYPRYKTRPRTQRH